MDSLESALGLRLAPPAESRPWHVLARSLETVRICSAAVETPAGTPCWRDGGPTRAHDKNLRVARTIADLAGDERIKPEQVSDAIPCRRLDRQL